MDYTLEIEIEKPRDEVIEKFTDQDNLPYWQPGFLSAELISGDENQPGSQTKLRYLNGKREVEMIETLEVMNPPEEFSATFRAPGMVMTVKNFFHELDDGSRTRYITENHCEISGFLMRMITILMPGCFKKQSLLFMNYFKDFVESGVDVRDKS